MWENQTINILVLIVKKHFIILFQIKQENKYIVALFDINLLMLSSA
jgi:hypothetical protein